MNDAFYQQDENSYEDFREEGYFYDVENGKTINYNERYEDSNLDDNITRQDVRRSIHEESDTIEQSSNQKVKKKDKIDAELHILKNRKKETSRCTDQGLESKIINIPLASRERWDIERKNALIRSHICPTRFFLSRFNKIKSNYYHSIPGFVVNVHDALNYDIDINSPYNYLDYPKDDSFDDLESLNSRLIVNTYTYKTNDDIKIGVAYRCRLRGIKVNNSNDKDRSTLDRKLFFISVSKLIDREDGWIDCIIRGIDVYGRLLIDAHVGGLSLKKYLLDKAERENSLTFQSYADSTKLQE